MSHSKQLLNQVDIQFNENGVPVSSTHDDVYYAGSQPLIQSNDIFIQGNGLGERMAKANTFVILETGFGLGVNFLATWSYWKYTCQMPCKLRYVSFEAHPISHKSLSQFYKTLPNVERSLGNQLLKQLPEPVNGSHRLSFENGSLVLDLVYGDINKTFGSVDTKFNACYLDGYAPRVNPEMWSDFIYKNLARMADIDATLATWCSAGHVRRGLERHGFNVTRLPGFEGKRHSIIGQWQGCKNTI